MKRNTLKVIKVDEADFYNLKVNGMTSIYDSLQVGKEYLVECPTRPDDGQLKVRCSQNCPVTIKTIEV